MMKKLRRKSTVSKAASVEEPLDTSEEGKRYRMRSDDQDGFIKLCVEYFDVINDTTTIRGTPNSSKLREKKFAEAWQKITASMNQATNVSRTE